MTDTTPAPIGEDALREALWICVEHNALHFGERHNTVVQGRAALAGAAPAAQGDALDAARYRRLRECNSGSLVVAQITGTGEEDWQVLTERDADEAIDAEINAARAAKEGEPQ